MFADHGKDSDPPPFVQSINLGCWNLIATLSSGEGGDELMGLNVLNFDLRHG